MVVTGSDNTRTCAASFFCGCVCLCVCTFFRALLPRLDVMGCALFRVMRGVGGPAGMLCGREGCSRETRVMNKVAPRVFSLTCPLVCSAGRGGSAAPVSLVRMPPYRGFFGHSPDGAVASPPRLCTYVAGTSHCTRPYLYQWSGAGSPAHAYASDGRLLRKGYPPSDPRSAATNEP